MKGVGGLSLSETIAQSLLHLDVVLVCNKDVSDIKEALSTIDDDRLYLQGFREDLYLEYVSISKHNSFITLINCLIINFL